MNVIPIKLPALKERIEDIPYLVKHFIEKHSKISRKVIKDIKNITILGAGMMGQGIAYVSAKAGMQVILKDISAKAAKKGKAYSENLLSKAVARGWMDEAKKAAILDLIKPTADDKDLDGCDLIVEAVFESIDVKAQVTQNTEPYLTENGIFYHLSQIDKTHFGTNEVIRQGAQHDPD